MKKYPAYKPSGIDWIGEVPEHWEKKRLKNLTPSTVGGIWGNERLGDKNDRVCLRVADFDYERLAIWNEDNTIRNVELGEDDPKLLNRGDLLLEKSGGGEKTPVGRCVYYDGQFGGAVCSNFINVLHPDLSIVNPRFLTFLHSYFYRVGVNTQYIKQTTGIQNLDINSFLSEVSFLPPLPEQQTITSYLDHKTALIDTLIEKTTQKIALLQEQRTALINQAVTKGLDPCVPMKDSGVEWIGEVPRHWEVKKLKHVSKIFGRIGYRGYTTEDIVDEGEGAISLSPSNVVNHQLVIQKCTHISWGKYHESPEIMVFPGDIVLVKTGSTIGKTALIPQGTPEMTLNPQLVVLKDIGISPEYLYYSMTCEFFQGYLLTETVGGSTPTISQEKILNFPVVLPATIEEQERISKYLLEETQKVDTITHQEQQKITLLKEYRQALISEVVTGKIDVRDA